MNVNMARSTTSLNERKRRNYKLMAPSQKRTCLSAESALTGHPNVEDVPLGAKLPMIPGNRLLLYTTNLCEKLHLPSCDFDRTYPSDVYVSNEYRCLHDPHLKSFFVQRPAMRKRLRRNNYITPEQKVVCSLKEYNLYRQYLKHLSIEYLNKKYLEQYEEEHRKNMKEIKEKIEKKRKDVENPINLRIERARKIRAAMEKELTKRRKEVLREAEVFKERRRYEREEEQLLKMLNEETRERSRENDKQQKEVKQIEDSFVKKALLNVKHKEDLQREKIFREKIKRERKLKQQVLIENYRRKKEFHHARMLEIKRILADEDMKRKARAAEWEKYFAKRHKALLAEVKQMKEKDGKIREKRDKIVEKRLRLRGWTGNVCRAKLLPPAKKESATKETVFYGVGDGSKLAKAHTIQQLSAMGFHDVMMAPDILKAMWNIDEGDIAEHSSGDAAPVQRTLSQQAWQFCDDIMRHGYASEYVRHVVEVAQELEAKSTEVVTKVIDVSRNVLLPMLEAYEERAGVRVATAQIPDTLHDLISGVFDEEEDTLPEIVSFNDLGRATVRTGAKDSSVRFVVSNSDLPLELHLRKNRPPTPKRVKFSTDSDDSLGDADVCDTHLVIDQTINQLSEKVVKHAFTYCEKLQREIEREDMLQKINDVAASIIDEILLFGVENAATQTSSSPTHTSEEKSEVPLEEKISCLAQELIITEVYQKPPKEDDESNRASSSASSSYTSSGSSLSILALQVVKSILETVDPNTGKSIKEHTATCEGLEQKVAHLSAKIVEEVVKEKKKQKGEVVDPKGFAELEEKISKLALNIVTSAMGEKRPGSSTTLSSLSSIEIEERVVDLSARIIGGIISLKKILPKDRMGQELPQAKPSDSVDRVFREIFNLEALQQAPHKTLQKVTKSDVKRISDDIAKRLVPPRDDSSALSSGMSKLADAIAKDVIDRTTGSYESTEGSSMSDAVNALADIVVGKTLSGQKVSSGESNLSSGISAIAGALTEEALLTRQTATAEIFSSSESKLSSAISDIAEAIMQSALENKTSSGSAISSGASKLAAAIAGETILSNVLKNNLNTSSSSALESGISDLVNTTVDQSLQQAQVINSSTKSAISSGIKTLADKIAHQVVDIAAADPEGVGSSTRSAISSGANHLASQIASMITGQQSVSSATLESVLSSAVTEMVADLLTQKVMQYISEQGNENIETENLAAEVARLVQNMLGLKISDNKLSKTSVVSSSSKDPAHSSEMESGVSDLASDVVRELLSNKDAKERPSDESASSAISAVASRYVHQVLGIPSSRDDSDDQKQVREPNVVPANAVSLTGAPPPRTSATDLSPSTNGAASKTTTQKPRPPKTERPKKSTRKSRGLKGMSTGSLLKQTVSKPTRPNANFHSSFTDWRQGVNEKGKSLSALREVEERQITLSSQTKFAGDIGGGATSDDDFNNIMEILAIRIVTSVVRDENEGEGASPVVQELTESRSVEQLVGTLALGIVTSLLGLDVLNNAEEATSSEGYEENENTTEASDEAQAPGPSAGVKNTPKEVKKTTQDSGKDSDEEKAENCKGLLNILRSTDGSSEHKRNIDDDQICEDNALEHPHRVRSPTRGAKEPTASCSKKKTKSQKISVFTRNWFTPKTQARKSDFETTPLKPSAGFLSRRSLTDTNNLDKIEKEVCQLETDLRHLEVPSQSNHSDSAKIL